MERIYLLKRNCTVLMNSKKEIVFHFPLKKEKGNTKIFTEKGINETETNEKLRSFFKLTEKFRNDEWHQEYFLIYNSYTLDNP
jgi:hypothetical protein